MGITWLAAPFGVYFALKTPASPRPARTLALAAVVAWLAWPELAKTPAAYGLAARLPVAVIMFLAMRGEWGAHYDYVGMGPAFQMPFWPRFLWLAFFPQLVFWVGFTVVAGMLFGSAAIVLFKRRS